MIFICISDLEDIYIQWQQFYCYTWSMIFRRQLSSSIDDEGKIIDSHYE
jgi:hypothetical protein